MKKLIVLILFCATVIFAFPAPKTSQVKLGWDQPNDPIVIGYKVYWGIASRQYTNYMTVPGITNTTCTITNLQRGNTYWFAATCYTAQDIESDYSNEAFWTVYGKPVALTNLNIITATMKE